MKKIVVLSLFLLTVVVLSAQKPTIIDKVFIESVEGKVNSMQKLIGFDDEQAAQLREMELNFLKEVNKAEHCFLCNKRKRVERLKQARDESLQKILSRDQYIKYDAVENERMKGESPIRVE